uniref:HERV-H LTR-associating 2a, tandem duplicate 2 n=1 Tax=Oryzias latipes TaxID=8090 RepID=A0A3P9HW52_ORYLA
MAVTHAVEFLLLVFLEKLSWSDAKVVLPDANVTCIIPEDCILPCSFKPASTVVIHWYKQQIPVHSYYYNKDQFGLQNKHFSGRTCLFNSHIPHGNASLLLRRVKVQDRGRYKCYTSTRKSNQEMFVNLEVKAPIQMVTIKMTEEWVTCSSQNVYPVPQVSWATNPPSSQEALENSTIRTTDHKGLFTVESMLRIVGNFNNYTYLCSFKSSDKTEVWTASWKNQEDVTNEEGHPVLIPCNAPQMLHNFSLTWTFSSSSEPTLILRYDNRTRQTTNQWEGQAELDQDLVLLGDGSLLLNKPDSQEHSGTYTCMFTALHSKHIFQTKVNITVAAISVDEQNTQRSWWSSAASAAFVLFTVIVALLQCVKQNAKENSTASHRHNGTGVIEGGRLLYMDLNPSAIRVGPHGADIDKEQAQSEVHNQASSLLTKPKDCDRTLGEGSETEQEEKPVEPAEEANEEQQEG